MNWPTSTLTVHKGVKGVLSSAIPDDCKKCHMNLLRKLNLCRFTPTPLKGEQSVK